MDEFSVCVCLPLAYGNSQVPHSTKRTRPVRHQHHILVNWLNSTPSLYADGSIAKHSVIDMGTIAVGLYWLYSITIDKKSYSLYFYYDIPVLYHIKSNYW